MARGDILKASLRKRINEGKQELTVHYPPARTAPTGTAPGLSTGLVSPLTGVVSQPTLVQQEITPAKDPVTMKCIWTDRTSLMVSMDNRAVQQLGWIESARAMARVLVEDAAIDPDEPSKGTIFVDASYVEHEGRRFRVLQIDPIGIGTLAAYSYAVWLIGAEKQ